MLETLSRPESQSATASATATRTTVTMIPGDWEWCEAGLTRAQGED